MSSYECPSCHNQSDMPGVCQTPGCPMNGQPLKEIPEENTAIDSSPLPTENPEATDTINPIETSDMPLSNPEAGAPEAPVAGNDTPATPTVPDENSNELT